MDKAAAQKLVRETLQGSFNKERFVSLIKNLLNHVEDAPFTYKGQYIFADFQDSIKLVERIGKYKGSDEKLFDILVIHLQKETSLERARTKQRNFVAKYLKGSRGDVLKDAALVAFVAPDGEDWRFSFIKMEYKFNEKGKVAEEFTPARRYSFLVGKNETSHTAQSRLLPLLLDDEGQPTLQDLEDAFSVEKATKEFFEKYRYLFLRLKEKLVEIVEKDPKIKTEFQGKQVGTVDFAKKLLGQIVFLYFLQKKGWFGVQRGCLWGSGSQHFLRELFDKQHGDYKNFFNDILEPLFYEALRLERPGDYYSHFDCRIPFLNGGLFDPINDYDWIETEILLPDDLFSNDRSTKEGDIGDGILDVFDRYNFTVKEDEPLEKEVAVDPEMLGKVFENLLEVIDRKSKGTYYTPREIVHYMCQESLIEYLYGEFNRGIVAYETIGDHQMAMFGNESKKEQLDLTIEHRQRSLIDKKDIETLTRYGESVVEHESRVVNEGRETGRYSFKLPESIRAKAPLIDKKLEGVRVCDPAVGSGAFVVGMMNEIIRARGALTPHIGENQKRTPYDFKRHAIQNCLYGVDVDSGAIEIAKLRLWLSLVVDEEERESIQPLPNLDYKIVCGNSLLGVNKLFNHDPLKKLEELKPLYFNETSAVKKQKHKKQIDDLISQITNGHKDFDFEVYFSEVFHEKKGFDVVIANPPYVKEDVNKQAFDDVRDSECYQGKMDLWYLFGCRGLDIAKNEGVICFIATNNWISNDGASKFRNKVISQAEILEFLDFGNYKIFAAGIQTMVLIAYKKSEPSQYTLTYGRLNNDKATINALSEFLNSDINSTHPEYEKFDVTFHRKDYINSYISFIPISIGKVLEKVKAEGKFNLKDEEIFSGADVMQDFITRKHLTELKNEYSVGGGVFVLSDSEKSKTKWNKSETEIIKPYYTTKEINHYSAEKQNRFWLLYAGTEVNKRPDDFPNIKKHLDQFQSIITSVNKPYGLHRTRDENIFLGDKILSVRKCAKPSFAFVDFPCYVSRAFLIIKTERVNLEYLLPILNSRMVAFWLFYKGKRQGNQYQVDKTPLMSIPVKDAEASAQKKIVSLSKKIADTARENDYLENPSKQAKVREYEKQIDQLVYKLYDLSPEEIEIVENS